LSDFADFHTAGGVDPLWDPTPSTGKILGLVQQWLDPQYWATCLFRPRGPALAGRGGLLFCCWAFFSYFLPNL